MQIFSDAIVEEQQKHTNTSSNNSEVKTEPENVQQNIIQRHSFTNAIPKAASTAPIFSTPENRSLNLAYSNGLKNGRKRPIKEEVIVLENLNLDISQSTSTDQKPPRKSSYRKQYNKSIEKPKFKSSPLHVNVSRLPLSSSDPFSIDSCFSQECSSTHSDDNSILSPVEATECVMRTMGLASDGNDTWQSWDTSESKSPRPDLNEKQVDENPTEAPKDKEETPNQEKPIMATDPNNINLNDSEMDLKKPTKPAATKDPESGLTLDTVKRRKLCSRYDHLLANKGVSHRLEEIPHLTNIQVAGLLRRSRNRPEMADVSENVWNFVFEERRRVEDRSYSENIITSKEFNKKLNMMKTDDADEATDCSDFEEDYNAEFENGFPFEEVQNIDEEDQNVHEILKTKCEFFEMRRYVFETDRWLCLLKRSLLERNARAKQIAEQITKKPTLQFRAPSFDKQEDTSEHCARCMPVNVLNRPKILKHGPRNNVDLFNFIKNSEHLSTLENDLSRCLEDLSLKIKDEDFSVLAGFKRSIQAEPRIVIENMSEVRRREARERTKKAAERLNNLPNSRCVGRPLKNRSSSRHYSDRKHLKRKASSDHRERVNSNEITILQENPSELRSFEEQLRRLSNNYKYSEIEVPIFRPFDIETYSDKPNDRLSRKPSVEFMESQPDVAGPSIEPCQPYDPMFYARVHHEIEFPKLTEEQIRKKRKEKWSIGIPEYVPFSAEKYEHEDPRNIVQFYCMTNEKMLPFSSRFDPGIISRPCTQIHKEPKVISMKMLYRQKAPTPNSNVSQELS